MAKADGAEKGREGRRKNEGSRERNRRSVEVELIDLSS